MNTKFFERLNLEEMHDLRQSLLRLAASIRMLMNVKQLSPETSSLLSATIAENQSLIFEQFANDLLVALNSMQEVALLAKTGSPLDIQTPTGSSGLTFDGDSDNARPV
jgi:hypothetical protein